MLHQLFQFTFIVLFTALSVTVLARTKLTCGSFNCGSNDRCCNDITIGRRCYNPTTHACINNQRLCYINDKLCGNRCYSPATHQCINNLLCALNNKLCGTTCYDPYHYHCSSGVVVRGAEAPVCAGCTGKGCCANALVGGPCFNLPSQYCCTAFAGTIVCNVGQICGSILNCITCLDPTQFYFDYSNTFGQICRVGTKTCSTSCPPR
jgi:hypothetical protein